MKKKKQDLYQNIGWKIRDLRKAAGVSQEKLGKILNDRTQGSIGQMETASRRPDLETLLDIATHFKVGLEYFFEDDWKVSRRKKQAVLILDGLNLRQAFDQYLTDTPFEKLRTTEEVRLKALNNPEGLSKAMVKFAESERLWYSYGPTPKEWNALEKKVALRRGGYRSVNDVLQVLETLRDAKKR